MKKLYYGLAIAFIIILIFGGIVGAQDEDDDPSPVPVEEITLDPPPPELDVCTYRIVCVEVFPESATNKNLIWTSSNPDVATVEAVDDNCARVKANGPGTAIITVTTEDGEFSQSFTINPKYPDITPPTGGMQQYFLIAGAVLIFAAAAIHRRFKTEKL